MDKKIGDVIDDNLHLKIIKKGPKEIAGLTEAKETQPKAENKKK